VHKREGVSQCIVSDWIKRERETERERERGKEEREPGSLTVGTLVV
jgi:hypothetical protein